MLQTATRLSLAALLAAAALEASTTEPGQATPAGGPADRLMLAASDTALRALAGEALVRNPGLAAAAARHRAVLLEVPQARALPDPMAEVILFPLSPETRVGPQKLTVGVSQALPWSGKLGLKQEAALLEARALDEQVKADRVSLVTEVRRLYYELLFLDRQEEIIATFREHLVQHEQISRARYATGVGPAQAVVKLQAEITRVERELLDLEARRLKLAAQVNRLRDRPVSTPIERAALPEKVAQTELATDALIERARTGRRELYAAEAQIARAETLEKVAKMAFRPDFTVGLTYTLVDPRDDAAGRLMPPPGNGDDILGIRGGIRIPVWRGRLSAGVEQAVELQVAAASAKADLMLSIESAIGDMAQRLPLAWRQLRLVEDLLIVQAEEALESAQAGYVAGTLNALDLLDAEHILFEATTAAARAKTDYLVGLAMLEGAVGEPLGLME